MEAAHPIYTAAPLRTRGNKKDLLMAEGTSDAYGYYDRYTGLHAKARRIFIFGFERKKNVKNTLHERTKSRPGKNKVEDLIFARAGFLPLM